MDGGAWLTAVYGVKKSRTRLSDFTFTIHFHALEKEMATHSSVLAWRIPGTGEPGGLPFMGSHRVGHDWSDLAAVATAASSSNNSVWSRERTAVPIMVNRSQGKGEAKFIATPNSFFSPRLYFGAAWLYWSLWPSEEGKLGGRKVQGEMEAWGGISCPSCLLFTAKCFQWLNANLVKCFISLKKLLKLLS